MFKLYFTAKVTQNFSRRPIPSSIPATHTNIAKPLLSPSPSAIQVKEFLLQLKPRAYCLDVPGITPPPDFLAERPGQGFAGCRAAPERDIKREDNQGPYW